MMKEQLNKRDSLTELFMFSKRHGGVLLSNYCGLEFTIEDEKKWISTCHDIMFAEIWERLKKII
jgi:hypothetical protein